MTTLITGGAGFIGSHLADLLVAQGERVVVLDDLSIGFAENLAEAQASGLLRFVKGSVLDEAAVAQAIEGCDVVFHLAVQCVRRSIGRPMESHDVNATGTMIALEAARRSGVDRFVYCSSSEVYGNSSSELLSEDTTICAPVTVYGAAKLAGELYTHAYHRTYGMKTLVIRPFNAYGPRAYQTGTRAEVLPRFVGRVLNGLPPVIFGTGSNARDFTYVTEVARGLALAAASDALIGQTVNIAFGRAVSVAEMADLVLAALRRNDLGRQMLAERPGDVHHLHADTRKAERMLGYKAAIGIEEGIAKYIDWVRSTYPDPSALLDTQLTNWVEPTQPERSHA